jgi:hypothetical protein
MRKFAALLLMAPLASAEKLNFEERVRIVRGLMAEYAKVKTLLPRSKKPLPFDANGSYDRKQWEETAKEFGPAARVGDMIQITKVELEGDKILLEINGGMKGGRKWYERIEVGMGTRTSPIATGNSAAPGGTNIAVLFHKALEPMDAADIKKILSPIFDFEKRSATEIYAETLPPEVQQAIKEKRAREGMDRDQVMLALGRPENKLRETKDGMELEDWVFGKPPGKITFVTFHNNKVIKVKETYAGLGAEAAEPLPVVR